MLSDRRRLGRLALILGGCIVLLVALPSGCWPLCLGIGLIAVGLCLLRQ